MTEDAKPKPKLVTPSDALDLSDLWLDPGLGDGITERCATASRSESRGTISGCIPIRRTEGRSKSTGTRPRTRSTKSTLSSPVTCKDLEEAAPYTLAVCIYRDGTPRVWPLRLTQGRRA